MIQESAVTAEAPVARRVRRGGTLICLVGIDGSGKSTQAAALVDSLRRQDVDAVHAWARWKPMVLLPLRHLGRALARRKGGTADDYGTFTDSKRAVLRGSLRAALWKNLALLEHAGQVFFKVGLPLVMGRTVVADRARPIASPGINGSVPRLCAMPFWCWRKRPVVLAAFSCRGGHRRNA